MHAVGGERRVRAADVVAEAQVEPEPVLNPMAEDAEPGPERRRALRLERERDRSVHPSAVERGRGRDDLGDRPRLRRQVLLPRRQCEVEGARLGAGQPDRRVPAREAALRPGDELVAAEAPEPVLVVAGEPVADRPVAEREREAGRVRALRRLLGEQDLAFGLEPVERQGDERLRRALEKAADLALGASRPERRHRVVDAGIENEAMAALSRQGEVLDEVRLARRRCGLVRAADAKRQCRQKRGRCLGVEDRDPGDLAASSPDRVAVQTRSPAM